MPDFVSLTCPSCGGKLQITDDIDRFACGHCGNEHIVRRSGGIVALAPAVEGLERIQLGTEITACELAIRRLRDDIIALEGEISRLASETCRNDFSNVRASLQAIGKLSRRESVKTDDIEHCQRLIEHLSSSESQRLIFTTRLNKNTMEILQNIRQLKGEVEQKRIAIKKKT